MILLSFILFLDFGGWGQGLG